MLLKGKSCDSIGDKGKWKWLYKGRSVIEGKSSPLFRVFICFSEWEYLPVVLPKLMNIILKYFKFSSQIHWINRLDADGKIKQVRDSLLIKIRHILFDILIVIIEISEWLKPQHRWNTTLKTTHAINMNVLDCSKVCLLKLIHGKYVVYMVKTTENNYFWHAVVHEY